MIRRLPIVIATLTLFACGTSKNNTQTDGSTQTDTQADTQADTQTDTQADTQNTGDVTVSVEAGKNDYVIDVNGVSREFIVYATESTLASEDVPVVFFFHGSNQTGELAYGVTPDGAIASLLTGGGVRKQTRRSSSQCSQRH